MQKKSGAVNSCRICASLGAVLAFKGIENCLPLIHGSQGCATYVRRYVISHFREPLDAASSSFSEESAVFGGGEQLKKAVYNVSEQYAPDAIGIASTCLTETLGEDVQGIVRKMRTESEKLPLLFSASTPSFGMSYVEAYTAALVSACTSVCERGSKRQEINFVISPVSPADLRELKSFMSAFGVDYMLLPDFSATLDSGHNGRYEKLPKGGTALKDIKAMPGAALTIEMGFANSAYTPGRYISSEYGVKNIMLPLPVGIELTDVLVKTIEKETGKTAPESLIDSRGRLVDSYIDAHKYLYGKRVAIMADPALAAGLYMFAVETGMKPVLLATGSQEGCVAGILGNAGLETETGCRVLEDTDFEEIPEAITEGVDIVIGNSKCRRFAYLCKAPLVEAGFPVHDRFGAQRIKHILYEGAMHMLDECVNALISKKQEQANFSWSYM